MSKNAFKHQVVIGDGFLAAKFAEHLPLIVAEQLTIVGADISNLDRGLAYRRYPEDKPWAKYYLMNSPSDSFGSEFVENLCLFDNTGILRYY